MNLINGVVEFFGKELNIVTGWVKLSNISSEIWKNTLEVNIYIEDKIVSSSIEFYERSDIKSKDYFGVGFKIKLNSDVTSIFWEKGEVVANLNDEVLVLKILDSVKVAYYTNNLQGNQIPVFLKNISENINRSLADGFNFTRRKIDSISRLNDLCVISYANDVGGWFPYFYKYYSELVGGKSIYIITPKPQNFINYELGGVITVPNMAFDDDARAVLMSSFASGLLSYFKWTLVCDIDEIIIPNPRLKTNLIEYIKDKSGTLFSLGLDVIQCKEDKEFDVTKSIFEQRSYAVLNSAICKPHLSKIPLRYTKGFHYCNENAKFQDEPDSILALHLKWADSNIRRQVSDIVRHTSYASENTMQYAERSIADDFHPVAKKGFSKSYSLRDEKILEFVNKYKNKFKYLKSHDIYIAEHFSANFVVDINDYL